MDFGIFKNFNYLGYMTPYYSLGENGTIFVNQTFKDAIEKIEKPEIDIPGLIEVISHYHCFGDRTLIKGLNRTPWFGKLNEAKTGWELAEVPAHSNESPPSVEIVHTLKSHLINELLYFLEGKRKVGILLSGGMDSRVLAGMLFYVVKEYCLDVSVIALSWGVKESRDVQYAKIISQKLNFDWHYFNLDPDTLITNIEYTSVNGCEFSPLHLHAMPEVRDLAIAENIDCIFAASYGDSIGRAEYSGKHVTNLSGLESYIRNWFNLFNSDLFKQYGEVAKLDASEYRKNYPHQNNVVEFELEKQSQYMRRQLNPCMGVINQVVPVYQLFTSPATYSYMWSIDPKLRNNQIYLDLISDLPRNLIEIPWARTGKKYLNADGKPDKYTKEHSSYGSWIRNDLKELIRSKIFSGNLEKLNIFNMYSIEELWKTNQKHYKNKRHSKVEEILIWLASVSDMIDRFDIDSEGSYIVQKSGSKALGTIRTRLEVLAYKTLLKKKGIK